MVETIAWGTDGVAARAFEGNILSIGSTLLWLSDALECTPDDLADLACAVTDNGGVYLVPAFSGLGAPWWDESATATLVGFGPGNGRAHLARAAFESIPLQIEDVLDRADAVSGARIEAVLADGGPTRNDWLMQQQADLSARRVERSEGVGLSAFGAAHLAGLSAGFWSTADVAGLPRGRSVFESTGADEVRGRTRAGWAAAVARSRFVPEDGGS
jgi:glycerol kinase